jgi:DNA-nicking Smr family endonuclease
LDEAYSAFVSFVRENAGAGRRALAVVTGRGDPAKGTGAIRREFPAWCGRLGGMISSYSPAGAGAFEIRLRKP